MGTLVVDSPFYSRPIQQQNAVPRPEFAPTSSESRVVDFIYRQSSGLFNVTYKADKIKDASRLQSILDPPTIPTATALPNNPTVSAPADPMSHYMDRLFYENNWPYARSALCRKYVKGIPDQSADLTSTGVKEDAALMKFQMFLNSSDQQRDLDFSYFGLGSTSNGVLLTGDKRLLYTFGFDWVAVPSERLDHETYFKKLTTRDGSKYIVRRRTCVAIILKMKSTESFNTHCAHSWDSKGELTRRRTVILFNELHSAMDGLGFQAWLSEPKLWTIAEAWNTVEDDEITAIAFIYRFVCQIWEKVLMEWKNVADRCSEHIRMSEVLALERNIKVKGLEDLAHNTWQDSLDWSTLSQLLAAQRKSVVKMSDDLAKLSIAVKATTVDEAARLQRVLMEMGDIETNLSTDFPQRGQSISDLVYNIIGVRNAQASEDYNKEIGSITWITFIFFPLIAVSGMFGMNVDVLANNPSIKWYFIIAIPITALVLLVALTIRGRIYIKDKLQRRKRRSKVIEDGADSE